MKDYLNIAIAYAEKAAKDARGTTHSRWVHLAARRFLRDLASDKRRAAKFPYYLDETQADNACDFLEKLHHVEGQWESPTIVLVPWQIFSVVNIFGWRRLDDGHRRFNTAYLEVARKNAKSTLAAGIGLYCLTCEDEPGPQVKTAATTGNQARIVFDVAKKMVERSSDLRDAFQLLPRAHSIGCLENAGSMQPINAKASTQDGLNPHAYILDELHAHPNRELFEVLKTARGARKNPLSFYITTAGTNIDGVCYEQRQLVERILTRVFDAEHYFGVIYTLDDPEVDVKNQRRWIKANPNLGVSVQLKEIKSSYEEARFSPDSYNGFLTKRMNVWTTAKDAWLSINAWNDNRGVYELEEAETALVYGGLDLAATTDLAGFVLTWVTHSGLLAIYPRVYVPESMVEEQRRKGALPYRKWVDDGYLVMTPGDVTDYAYIEKDIRDALDRFNIQSIGYDPWNAYDLVNRLTNDDAPMVEVRQGTKSFNAPMRELERRVKSKQVAHNGQPVLRWCATNLVTRRDVNENLAPDRKASLGKIDAAVASLMAMYCLLVEDSARSVYEDRGVIAL